MRQSHSQIIALLLCAAVAASCHKQIEHEAPAVRERDSVAMMRSLGVNTLISDSGVIKYRIVAERWDVNTVLDPSRWIFEKGIFFEQFDEKFHVQSHIQCDTAYYYDKKKLWELCGRVRVTSKNGLKYRSERLFWDSNSHELYSNARSVLVTPERELRGNSFRSDERMRWYKVSNGSGSFVKEDFSGEKEDTAKTAQDSVKTYLRPKAGPQRKSGAAR